MGVLQRTSCWMPVLALLLGGVAPDGALRRADAKDRAPAKAVESLDEVKKGKPYLLTAPKGMRYFIQVPKKYDPKKGAPLLVFLHGSNMNGMQYLPMFPARRWYPHAILVCPNGERGDDPFGANNFTQQAAPLVADVTEQVQAHFQVTHTYIGGHSQGGFVTYSVIMHFPELFQGALPMAGDCWMQNEPNLWETKPEVMARQKEIAIAVIHGQADPVVKFSQGEHAHGVFHAMGYPRLRFFAPERLGHQFGLSPVGEALTWLDAMNGLDPKAGLKAAAKWAKAKEWGWVHAATQAWLAQEALSGSHRSKATKLQQKAEAASAKAAAAMQERLEDPEADPKDWLPAWWDFWGKHGLSLAGTPLVERYLAKRAEQRSAGARLFQQAMGRNRGGDRDGCNELLERILVEAPYSFDAWYAVSWLTPEEE